ncbi:amidohydrolase, partial [Christiangramia aquimixticola]
MKYSLTLCLALLLAIPPSFSQIKLNPAPDRRADEGEGPFQRLIIRGAIVIDGTGAPPAGPADIVIE